MSKFDEGFLDYSIDNFAEYFDEYVEKVLKQNKKYKKVDNEIHKIKDEYPNVTAFIENLKKPNLTAKDKKAIDKLFRLEGILHTQELFEAYKLGLREGAMLSSKAELPKKKINSI